MKMFTTQRYEVVTKSGETIIACCGPRITSIPDVVRYIPIGKAVNSVCCHKGRAAELARMQTAELREFLRFRA